MKKERIVADGQQRIQQTEEYQRSVIEIRATIQEKYRVEMAQSGFFKRVSLRLKVQREIQREIQELAPDQALYFTNSVRKE